MNLIRPGRPHGCSHALWLVTLGRCRPRTGSPQWPPTSGAGRRPSSRTSNSREPNITSRCEGSGFMLPASCFRGLDEVQLNPCRAGREILGVGDTARAVGPGDPSQASCVWGAKKRDESEGLCPSRRASFVSVTTYRERSPIPAHGKGSDHETSDRDSVRDRRRGHGGTGRW